MRNENTQYSIAAHTVYILPSSKKFPDFFSQFSIFCLPILLCLHRHHHQKVHKKSRKSRDSSVRKGMVVEIRACRHHFFKKYMGITNCSSDLSLTFRLKSCFIFFLQQNFILQIMKKKKAEFLVFLHEIVRTGNIWVVTFLLICEHENRTSSLCIFSKWILNFLFIFLQNVLILQSSRHFTFCCFASRRYVSSTISRVAVKKLASARGYTENRTRSHVNITGKRHPKAEHR